MKKNIGKCYDHDYLKKYEEKLRTYDFVHITPNLHLFPDKQSTMGNYYNNFKDIICKDNTPAMPTVISAKFDKQDNKYYLTYMILTTISRKNKEIFTFE